MLCSTGSPKTENLLPDHYFCLASLLGLDPAYLRDLCHTIRILSKNNESSFCRLLKTDLYRRGWAGGASE